MDLGSGLGDFSRILSSRFDQVIGIDFSPTMINNAIQKSKGYQNIEFTNNDFMDMELETKKIDCIVSIACFHHLPMIDSLKKMKSILKDNGKILILDLYKEKSFLYYINLFFALIINRFYLRKNKNVIIKKKLNEVWKEHDKFDNLKSINKIYKTCKKVFKKVKIKRLLFLEVFFNLKKIM